MTGETIVVRLDEYFMHVRRCGHFRCILLLTQARPGMMQHLSSTALVLAEQQIQMSKCS